MIIIPMEIAIAENGFIVHVNIGQGCDRPLRTVVSTSVYDLGQKITRLVEDEIEAIRESQEKIDLQA